MTDIIIDPVTRIGGNASVRVQYDEQGNLQEARFQAYGYRGFERILEGAHLDNLLPIVSRLCGRDSLFHQMAAADAAERALGIALPEAARNLRRLAMWGQLFERHAVSLTIHSLPDLLFPSSDPGVRNIISIHRVDEEVIRRVFNLKSLGTGIIEETGGGAVHPVNFLPGGSARPLSEEGRRKLSDRLNESKPLLMETARLIKMLLRRNEDAVNTLCTRPTAYLSVKGESGIALQGDRIEVLGPGGESVGVMDREEIAGRIEEENSPHAHIRMAALAGAGRVRVGPLARVNVNARYGTPMADAELEELKSVWGFPFHKCMLNHAARAAEMIHAWERMMEILGEPAGEVTRKEIQPPTAASRGVGIVEAPEGMILYDLSFNDKGQVARARIVTPLQFNLSALEESLRESASALLGGGEPEERALNRLEMVARAYAPCVICGVH